MKNLLRTTFVLTALVLFFVNCEPDPAPPELPNEFIKFKINGIPFELATNDSTVFESAPGFGSNSNEPDSVFFTHYVTARVGHGNPDNSTWYESIIMEFRRKYPRSAGFSDPERNNSYRLRPIVFEELFAPGDWTWFRHYCQDSTRNTAEVSLLTTFTFQNFNEWWSAAGSSCDMPGNDQTGSSLQITEVIPAVHPEFGSGLLVTGIFTAKWYNGLGDTLLLDDGQFRVFVRR